jgi:hypothetical protein
MSDLTSQSTPIQSIYAWYRDDKLYVNRRYQRKLVWTLKEKQKLIESILKKYPIPAILIAEREAAPGTFEIIDGLQRLHAIASFIETTFPTLDNKRFDLTHFPTAKAKADDGLFEPIESESYLTQKEVSTILDYSLALSVMRNASEEEVNDVFDRINTYGHRLSDQERRQAGVQNDFSNVVRDIACTLRGDASNDILPLRSMPSISIDLPMTKHGYEVKADEVFWVSQGVLRATDLRDSMDEQCIADIAASVIGGSIIERSKDALDEIYRTGSDDANRLQTALEVYGANKFSDEFKFCTDEILKLCSEGKPEKLRDIVFASKKTTNAIPSVFAILLIAFHELIVGEKKKVTNYAALKAATKDLSERIDTGKRATSAEERRKNIDVVKALLGKYFVESPDPMPIYGNHASVDIEAIIRRSQIELSDYELKQGLLTLNSKKRQIDTNMIPKVVRTICAIANNGGRRTGKIVIGVTDKKADADAVKQLDGLDARKVGQRYVVGVAREAKALGISLEKYFSTWTNGIKESLLSEPLKGSVLSNIDYNEFYGIGMIVITIPPQDDVSFVGESAYFREADSTVLAKDAKRIAAITKRF